MASAGIFVTSIKPKCDKRGCRPTQMTGAILMLELCVSRGGSVRVIQEPGRHTGGQKVLLELKNCSWSVGRYVNTAGQKRTTIFYCNGHVMLEPSETNQAFSPHVAKSAHVPF